MCPSRFLIKVFICFFFVLLTSCLSRGGCGSAGRAGRLPIGRSVAQSSAPPEHISKCSWARYRVCVSLCVRKIVRKHSKAWNKVLRERVWMDEIGFECSGRVKVHYISTGPFTIYNEKYTLELLNWTHSSKTMHHHVKERKAASFPDWKSLFRKVLSSVILLKALTVQCWRFC